MRKLSVFLIQAFIAFQLLAVPAHPGAVSVTQPDGTQLTIELIGDEFYHFNTTTDGYTVVKNEAGIFEYAQRVNDMLVPSGVKAHNLGERNATENTFVLGLTKRMTDRVAHRDGEARRVKAMGAPGPNKIVNYKNFRGLIILVNYSDVKFTMSDPNKFYNEMVNTHHWNGYTDDNGKFVECTGSVWDYYSENSGGKFQPEFDIIGPVEVNYKATDMNKDAKANTIFKAAANAAHQMGCDFSKYDGDNDGFVDMIFFQVAGYASAYSGNDARYLWPHKGSYYATPTVDGKKLKDYACSTELYGWESMPNTVQVEGIGTICHEFSHVMGLPDLYDVNYEVAGQIHHPDQWDIMAGGGVANYGRTPCAFTIFERYAMKFANPKVITEAGHYTLKPINECNDGYIFRSPVDYEYFICDNRQKTRWDAYLPGHGMVVCRVDSTDERYWDANLVACNEEHIFYEMLRAGNSTSGNKDSDPFPGSSNNTKICSTSTPALKTWDGTTSEMGFFNIKENEDGTIEFDIINENDIARITEDFETMPTTTNKTATGVQGHYSTWDFNQCYVAAPGEGKCKGEQSVAMFTPSALTMSSPVYYDITQASFDFINPTTVTAKVALQYSTDGGATWEKAKPTAGTSPVSVLAGTTQNIGWAIGAHKTQPTQFRIQVSAGSKNAPCYVDNFAIFYDGEPGGPSTITGDVNGDGVVDIADVNACIDIILGVTANKAEADVNGDGSVDIADVNKIIDTILGL
ncbi:MAG: M6 family metalloprotease domain-containing protein [Bacteroidales bacterium]|nr:M6 family metalloprotease domain-containing protein [Candidatus Sodaliphilus fimicaballi]